MATPTTSVSDYCTLLAKSKLLPADEVEALHRKWRDDTRHTDDRVEAFVAFLIRRRIVTPYQAAMVQRGRADGFFLNGYKILDRIGKGQMGSVYKAVHTLGQLVALKILPASKAKDPHVLGRFQRESRLITQLDHPNVVRPFQVGDASGVHYIVMEFLEGETLDEVLNRRKKLPIAEAVRLIRQALDGLDHLHDRRMVHRDLKPANLMLTPAGGKPDTTWDATLKILDIGLGRELFDENTPEGQIETQLTVEGAVLGTPDYLAPEQARDARGADIRADIYSLGCVLYHCLTGRTPFPEQNIMTQMLRHATEKPLPLRDFVSHVPPGLQEVFDTLTAKDPAHRYQTPAAAAAALEPFLAPNAGAAVSGANLVPAYRQWLETESHMELRKLSLPEVEPKPEGVKPGTGLAPTIEVPVKRGTLPAPKPGTAPAPALKNPVKPGTAPVPAYQPPKPGSAPHPVAPARAPVPPRRVEEEVEVELVSSLPPARAPIPIPLPEPEPLPAPDDRPLWELSRRDLVMLVGGGAGVAMAVGSGYLLALLLRRKRPEGEDDKKE